MLIGTRKVGIGYPPFLIAEASINHQGSIDQALAMIHVAKQSGCDAVKFQTFKAEDVCDPKQMYTYGKITEPRIDIFRRCELPETAWPILKAECDKIGIMFMSTPETPADLDILLKVGISVIKIGSDNLTNLPMLRYCARDEVGLPVIISTGMSDMGELRRALWILDNPIIMVCTSQYPCSIDSLNLRRITYLLAEFNASEIGFSDHSLGSVAAPLALASGASVFETHFTLDNNLPGPEHWWAKNPSGLESWVTDIKDAYTMMGSGELSLGKTDLENKMQYQRRVS